MAVRLVQSATEALTDSVAIPVVDHPFTACVWVLLNGVSGSSSVISICNSGSNTQLFEVFNRTPAGTVRFRTRGSGLSDAETVNTVSTGVWQLWVIRARSATDRAVILDGDLANKGAATSSMGPAGLNRIGIGYSAKSSPNNHADADLAFPTIWDVGLGDGEVVELALGRVHPLTVRPDRVVWYSDLAVSPWFRRNGVTSPAISHLTEVGTPEVAHNPDIGPAPMSRWDTMNGYAHIATGLRPEGYTIPRQVPRYTIPAA